MIISRMRNHEYPRRNGVKKVRKQRHQYGQEE